MDAVHVIDLQKSSKTPLKPLHAKQCVQCMRVSDLRRTVRTRHPMEKQVTDLIKIGRSCHKP